jgi:hypothetical protein
MNRGGPLRRLTPLRGTSTLKRTPISTHPRAKIETRPCTVCGKPVTTMASTRRKTCSDACRREAISRSKLGSLNPAYATPAEMQRRRDAKRATGRRCARPGCERGVLSGVRYCSRECHYADRGRRPAANAAPILRFRCERCGAEFERKPGRGTGRFCSAKCRRPTSAAAPPVPLGVRRAPERHLRKTWNAGCLVCVRCGRAAQRHHVVYEQHVVAVDVDQRYNIADRIGLCVEHHRAHHDRIDPVPLALLPDVAIAFAAELFGPGAHGYLTRRYSGQDARVEALLDLPLRERTAPGGTGHR